MKLNSDFCTHTGPSQLRVMMALPSTSGDCASAASKGPRGEISENPPPIQLAFTVQMRSASLIERL